MYTLHAHMFKNGASLSSSLFRQLKKNCNVFILCLLRQLIVDAPTSPRLHCIALRTHTQTHTVYPWLLQSLGQATLVLITCFISCLTNPHSPSFSLPAPLAVISISTQGPSVGPSRPVSHHKNKHFERRETPASNHSKGGWVNNVQKCLFGAKGHSWYYQPGEKTGLWSFTATC